MILREGRSPTLLNNRALRTMQMQTNKVKRMLPSVSYVIALWRTGVWSHFRVGCEIMTHTRLAGGGGVLLICDRPSRAGCVSWLCARLPGSQSAQSLSECHCDATVSSLSCIAGCGIGCACAGSRPGLCGSVAAESLNEGHLFIEFKQIYIMYTYCLSALSYHYRL